MSPRVKIDKESIINAATEIVRQQGDGALNARNIAALLNCSTQPIFSNFDTMNELRNEVIIAAERCYNEYIDREIALQKYPQYKAMGMAYILFAKEEKQLFRLLFMRDRSDEKVEDDTALGNRVYGILQTENGMDLDTAKLFHLEMWAFVHGLGVMTATDYLQLDESLCSKMLSDIFSALKDKLNECN